jgi:hypothetical protein
MSHELSQALGHLRQAAHQLLVQTDPTGQTLRLACQILDIENSLEEVGIRPVWVAAASSASDSTIAAIRLLTRSPQAVPSDVWPALENLLTEVGDHGHR